MESARDVNLDFLGVSYAEVCQCHDIKDTALVSIAAINQVWNAQLLLGCFKLDNFWELSSQSL